MIEAEIKLVFETAKPFTDEDAKAFWAAGSGFDRVAPRVYEWTRDIDVEHDLSLLLEQSRQAAMYYVNKAGTSITRWVQLSIQTPTRLENNP